jgi:hypothetical protein
MPIKVLKVLSAALTRLPEDISCTLYMNTCFQFLQPVLTWELCETLTCSWDALEDASSPCHVCATARSRAIILSLPPMAAQPKLSLQHA